MTSRPPIPAELERMVFVESGHRCAIPTCRQHPVQIHHIVDWAKSPEHRFENLIALCATCHDRVTRGQIDKKSVRQYKHNLGVLVARYEPFERRILVQLARQDPPGAIVTTGGLTVLFGNLLNDGLIEEWDQFPSNEKLGAVRVGFPRASRWVLTETGRNLAMKIIGAEPIDE